MVKYIIDDDNLYDLIDHYENAMNHIQGFKYGKEFWIRDLTKESAKQKIWVGYDYEECKTQLKVERARFAFRNITEKIS